MSLRSDREGGDKHASQWVDTQVDWLQALLFSHTPWYQFQILVDTITAWLSQAVLNSKAIFRRSNSPPESFHQIHTIVRFVNLIIHEKLKSLDLSKLPKMLRDALYKKLDKFTGLQVLSMGSGNGECARKRSFHSIKYLSNLTKLTLTNDCQNEILAVIGQNCARLKYLDISSSGTITDQGTAWLLLCKELETINLFQTSTSIQGYVQLLLGLPNLHSIGRCDNFGQILDYLNKHRTTDLQLPLETLHSRDMNLENLELYVRTCPGTKHVNLYVDEDGHLLTPLTKLSHLQELKLLACNFYSDRVDRLLRERGYALTLLHLEHVDQLDMAALCSIAQNCPRLRKLVFFSCDFVENFGSSESNFPFSEPPFQELETLVCVSESAPNVIQFLLINALNLKMVQFGSSAWFNDEIVSNVLARNALKKVEEIRILRSYELSMGAVRAMIASCPNLRVLGEMDGWEGIQEVELAELRHEIKEKNWDLDTFITWSLGSV
eukprot:TRINITY_DN13457_c0_g2_i2.p1 TRINITY_DN13457_c0_g2~~TRINITY_DN13457_c0_g2_i2.p1  ORF type:complete len:505 (+),score=59.58 TRINITY_DN13457_c0_g2_i2:37-1515(+)